MPDVEEDLGVEVEEDIGPPPLKLAKRFFHILGIDIIIDSEMNPQVLELNDRPSLGVTVEFEKDLKESVIADAFEHVRPNGEVRGNSPQTSRWTQIFPAPGGNAWRDVLMRLLNPLPPPTDVHKQPPPTPVATKSRLEFTQVRKDKKKKKHSVDKSSG
jgi:hypothetical protein